MQRTRSQATSRTQKSSGVGRWSATMISGKSPDFDYSFRPRKDIEDGGGIDMYGFEPVGADNTSGETWSGPAPVTTRAKGRNQIVLQDTILCRRPLETAKFFQRIENEKYNAQCRMVLGASKQANVKLRELDPGAVVVNSSTGLEKAMPQRPGPTQED